MNIGPNQPSAGGAGPGGRNKRGRRHRPQPGRGPGKTGGGGQHGRGNQQHSGIYTAPMDHSYRSQQNDGGRRQQRGGRAPMGTQYLQPHPDPVPVTQESASAPARIFAFIDELFFVAKIQETARKLNVKVEFVKSDKEIFERMEQNGNEKPSLVIVDLNNAGIKPLATIAKLRSKLKKQTAIIAFLSHLQGELKVKAQEAGCDMVLPRSAFSQNLPQLLRRHGAPEEE
jgi:CheY-like chemotaxis protein